MTIRLVAAPVWRRAMAKCGFDAAPPLALAILAAFQDAHVGITPSLAAALAAVVSYPSGPSVRSAGGGPWRAVFSTLAESLADRTAPCRALSEARDGFRFGVVPGSNALYSILRVALPLVRDASKRCGKSYLMHDGDIGGVTDEEYSAYDAELQKVISVALAPGKTAGPFEFEHGNTLSTFSHFRDPSATTSLPAADPLTAALLLSLKPELPPARWQPRQAPERVSAPRNKPSPGVREENIEGIRFSLREGDLDQILVSEFLNPEPILLERLTSRFLIHERRPPREKLRDVLVIGMMPHQVAETCAGSLMKASWADCMARFGLVLANYHLYRTEFRWIEGDTFSRFRDCSFLLEDLVHLGRPLVWSDSYRRRFLTDLGWLPDFTDNRAEFRRADWTRQRPGADWIETAWSGQCDHPRWRHEDFREDLDAEVPTVSHSRPIHLSRFAVVHTMALLPPDLLELPDAERRESSDAETDHDAARNKREQRVSRKLGILGARLGLGAAPRRNLSITIVPRSIQSDEWAFCPRHGALRSFDRAPTAQPSLLAGQIERTWLDQLVREVWYG